MNSNLGNLFARRASAYNFIAHQYLRPKSTTFLFANRNSPNLHAYSLSTSRNLPFEKKNLCKPTPLDSYCQIGSRALSSNLPHVDIDFDVRKLHHIFQFGLAVKQIFPRLSDKVFKEEATMPPTPVLGDLAEASDAMEQNIKSNTIMIFSKSYCPFCNKVKQMFKDKGLSFKAIELDQMGQIGINVQAALLQKTGQKTVPSVFFDGKHIGGCDDTMQAAQKGIFTKRNSSSGGSGNADSHNYDYDIIVIGGGSGGLAASKEAAKLGLKVAVYDFVTPTPIGTTWGLGGTCVNVGCIPKKLMHQASILGENMKDAKEFGWQFPEGHVETHSWEKMVENIQGHIKGLNWGYKTQLRSQNVKYFNELASFTGPNTIKATNKKGEEKTVTAAKFILATGGRPVYPNIPGAKEFGITSDDVFSMQTDPGKTLLIGASYIALENAGFLSGMGKNVTIMVRSILLRGFDQQIAEKIGEHMENKCGINFVRKCVPTKLERIEEGANKGMVRVHGDYQDGTSYEDIFNTVMFAVGRQAETENLGLGPIGVTLNPKNKKCIVDEGESSNVPHIFAIGDMIDGRPELTPVAIQAGRLLARRIAGTSSQFTDYDKIPTTVFTPLEYGCCGLSEEDALSRHGGENIEVYHTNFWPLEWTLNHDRPDNACYAKLICDKKRQK